MVSSALGLHIGQISDSQITPTNSGVKPKLVGQITNPDQLNLATSDIVPAIDNFYNLGTAQKRWASINVAGSATYSGGATFSSAVTVGGTATTTINGNGSVSSFGGGISLPTSIAPLNSLFYQTAGGLVGSSTLNFTNGNLGVGTTNPTAKFQVSINSGSPTMFNDASQEGMRFQNLNTTANNWEEMLFTNGNGGNSAAIAVQNVSHSSQNGNMVFATGRAGTGALTASMVLDNNGGMQMGGTFDSAGMYTNSSANTLGLFVGPQALATSANGPMFFGRGNTFSTNANQRGNAYMFAGAPSAPGATEGMVSLNTGSIGQNTLTIDKDGYEKLTANEAAMYINSTGAIGSFGEYLLFQNNGVNQGAFQSFNGTTRLKTLTAGGQIVLAAGGGTIDDLTIDSTGQITFNKTAKVAGGFIQHYTQINSSTYSVTSTDGYLSASTTSAAPTFTLPQASTLTAGFTIKIKDRSCNAAANNITVTSTASTIDTSGSSYIIGSNCAEREFVSDGVSNWEVN